MRWLSIILLGIMAVSAYGQKYPDRHDIRAGNRAYGKQGWNNAEERYRRALEKDPDSRAARYNLGSVLYRQEQWDEAQQAFESADAPYNAGNALFGQRKLEEALEAYKNAMRADPTDVDAKFNYAYVKKLLENQQDNSGGGGEGENEQNSQNEEQGESESDPREGEGQEGDQQQQGGMSRQDAAQMLDALQAQEDRTQEKLNGQRVEAVGRSGKNW